MALSGPRGVGFQDAAVFGPLRRAFIVVACVLAFGFQSFIAQIHIHPSELGKSPAAVTRTLSQTLSKCSPVRLPDQGPENPAKCPLCQVAASLGSALGVSSLLIVMSAVPLLVEPVLRHDRVRRPLPGYVWRSRGPPQL